MSKTISEYKAKAIAEAFCVNGFSKTAALETVGYSKAYSRTTSAHKTIFNNDNVRIEIDKIMARNADIVDVEVSEIIKGLRRNAFPSGDEKINPSDRNRALELLGKYKLMFTDKFSLEQTEQDKELTERGKIEAKILASICLHQKAAISEEVRKRCAEQGVEYDSPTHRERG